MIILAALALTTLGAVQDAKPALTCPVLGTTAPAGGPSIDYKGVRYSLCCAMCPPTFQKDPEAAIHSDKAKGKTIGTFLFDPVSDARITDAQAKAWTDYDGVRYLFTSDDEKKSFVADPTKYTAIPAKESLFCPVEKQKLSGYAAAGSYTDYDGVRYYFCCGGCPSDFAKKPADYAKIAADYVATPKAIIPVAEAKAEAAPAFQAETFACIHCGRQMSVNTPDDLNQTCGACQCGKKASQCKG